MSILEKKVTEISEGIKIREYLKTELGLSTRLIRSASIDKRIFVNDEPVKMNRVLNVGETIKIDLAKDESQDIAPEKMDIEIAGNSPPPKTPGHSSDHTWLCILQKAIKVVH